MINSRFTGMLSKSEFSFCTSSRVYGPKRPLVLPYRKGKRGPKSFERRPIKRAWKCWLKGRLCWSWTVGMVEKKNVAKRLQYCKTPPPPPNAARDSRRTMSIATVAEESEATPRRRDKSCKGVSWRTGINETKNAMRILVSCYFESRIGATACVGTLISLTSIKYFFSVAVLGRVYKAPECEGIFRFRGFKRQFPSPFVRKRIDPD